MDPRHPRQALDAIRQQLPALAHRPLQTAQVVFMGFPIGHPKIIKDFLDEIRAASQKNFRNCYHSRLLKLIFSYSAGAPVQRSCIWLALWPLRVWKTLHNNNFDLLRTIWLCTLSFSSRLIRKSPVLIRMLRWDTMN